MLMNHGRWYFYGTDTKTRKMASFAFARAGGMKIGSEKFQNDPPAHPRELLRHSFGIVVSQEKPVDVVLEFDPKVVQRVMESVWHAGQRIEDLPGGRLRLVLPLNSTLEVSPWILSWGPYVRVVAPDALRESIADSVRRMAANYREV
jgi:predicted DNA-binding transcriptional regulator YafY